MAATIKAKGIVTFNPRDTAPNFVLGEMAISIDQLLEWCNGDGAEYLTTYKGERQLKLSVTAPKEGRGIIVSVNTWRPNQQGDSANVEKVHSDAKKEYKKEEEFRVPDSDDGLPF